MAACGREESTSRSRARSAAAAGRPRAPLQLQLVDRAPAGGATAANPGGHRAAAAARSRSFCSLLPPPTAYQAPATTRPPRHRAHTHRRAAIERRYSTPRRAARSRPRCHGCFLTRTRAPRPQEVDDAGRRRARLRHAARLDRRYERDGPGGRPVGAPGAQEVAPSRTPTCCCASVPITHPAALPPPDYHRASPDTPLNASRRALFRSVFTFRRG